MSEHIILRTSEPLPETMLRQLAQPDGRVALILHPLPLDEPYYAQIAAGMPPAKPGSAYYAISDSPRYLHCDYFIEDIVKDTGRGDWYHPAAFRAVAATLLRLVRMCPKPLDIYMSNDPGPGCERIVPTRLSEFIETFEASVETLVILPDLVLHVTD